MIIVEAKTSEEILEVIELVGKNTYHEYDVSREFYIQHIKKRLLEKKSYVAWLLKDNDVGIGYIIGRFDNYLFRETHAVDIFVMPGHQGKRLLKLLIDALIQKSFEVGSKRIKWHSYIFPEEFWSQHTLGMPVKMYKLFSCELTEEMKSVVEENRKEIKNVHIQ